MLCQRKDLQFFFFRIRLWYWTEARCLGLRCPAGEGSLGCIWSQFSVRWRELLRGGPHCRTADASHAYSLTGSVLLFFSPLLPFVCIRLSLLWPCLVGVKRRKLRCVFAVRCWRLQRQLPEEAGVEGQYSYWWLLRERKREEVHEKGGSASLQFESCVTGHRSEVMKNAQDSLWFRVTEKPDVNG